MRTTCPSCHAVFRVTPEQLEARGGKVRCGKCAFVFNGFDNLVTPIETVSLIAPPVEEPEVEAEVEEEHITLLPAPATVAEPLTATFPLPTDDQIDREAEEINRHIAASAHLELAREERKAEKKPLELPPPSKLEITPDLQEKLQNLQQELSSNEERARWRGLAWGLGVVLLGLVLVVQGAYFKRDWLAAHYPEAKPALQILCGVLQCKVELLADAERIKLDSSDLQTDPDHANTIILSATLRNLAPYRQAYPNLELTLTDANNQSLARRHFTPKDYLPKETKVESGMPSNEDVAVKLSLEVVGVNAVGYKLFVYYP